VLVLVLNRYRNNVNSSDSSIGVSESRDLLDTINGVSEIPDTIQGATVLSDTVALYSSLPLIPPSASPIYTDLQLNGKDLLIADYTGVPAELSGPLKCAENPGTHIVDFKYVPIVNGQILPGNSPAKLVNLNKDLAVAMAGLHNDCSSCNNQMRTPDTIWGMWKHEPTTVIGRMLERARETTDKLKENLIQQNLSDGEVAKIYRNELNFIKKLDIDNCCEDLDDKCKALSENNNCVINAGWMLKNCPKSCGACMFTEAQIGKLVRISDSRELPNCANINSFAGELAMTKQSII
jgi:hypothetical protein